MTPTQNPTMIAPFQSTCPIGYCTNSFFECQLISPDIACAENSWSPLSTQHKIIQPLSADPLSCTTFFNVQTPSTFGARCEECQYKGYIVWDDRFGYICDCYLVDYDPYNHCSSILYPKIIPTLNISATLTSAYCDAFQSRELGCFAKVLPSLYGSPNMLIPNKCCSEIYGPPPGQLVESGVSGWQECNTFGTFDPNEPFLIAAFRTCSGHGRWNPITYACECDYNWNGVQIGQDFITQQDVYSCRTCFGFFGPQPPLDEAPEETQLQFCSRYETPDEFGNLAECGGHGQYQDGICVCDYSQDLGFWKSVDITQTFERILGNGSLIIQVVTIGACSACSDNASPLNGCTSTNLAPVYVATLQPSVSPSINLCPYCLSLGNTALSSGVLINLSPYDPPDTPCCTISESNLVGFEYRVYNGTCVDSEVTRRSFATTYCQSIPGCILYSVHSVSPYFAFTFSADSSFHLVLSINTESGKPCATNTPTVNATNSE